MKASPRSLTTACRVVAVATLMFFLFCPPGRLLGQAQPVSLKLVKYPALQETIGANKGKVVLVYYWASYSPPDIRSLSKIVEMHARLSHKDLVILTVSLDDPSDKEAVLKCLQRYMAAFTNVLLDESPEVLEKLQVSALPSAFVFDRKGKHTAFRIEDETFDVPMIEKLLAKKLKEPSACDSCEPERKALKSGPDRGAISPLAGLHLNGPVAGRTTNVYYDLQTNARPSVFVFSQTTDQAFVRLMRKLDEEGGGSKLFVAAIMFPASEELMARAKVLVQKEKLPSTIVSVVKGSGGFGKWQIAQEAEITIVIFSRERDLGANLAFRKGEFDEKAIEIAMKEVAKLSKHVRK